MNRAIPISKARRAWLYILVAMTLAFLVLPTFIVVPLSFSDSQFLEFPPKRWSLRWYANYFGTPEWMAATRVSLVAALLTTLLATPLGTAAAYSIVVARARFGKVVRFLLLLPMVIPVILIGIGVFYVYIRAGLVNTMTGIVLAHTLLALPFVVVTVLSGLQTFDMRQEQVARSLGAPWLSAFMRVTFPQVSASIVSAALFSFIVSLDEVVIGLFIAGGERTVLTRRMFLGLRDSIDPTIAAISTLFIVVAFVVLGLVALLRRTRQRGSRPDE
jgi:putative spermidine/putrescine transport system permease protein